MIFCNSCSFSRRQMLGRCCPAARICNNVTLLRRPPAAEPRGVETMSWFRSHARLCSCVALLALALQLVLSFGHIHHKDILGQSALAPIADTLAVVSISDADAPTSPGRADHDHEDEYCSIYAIAALIGSAQQAAPPTLPVPSVLTNAPLAASIEPLPPQTRHLLSQARGPPLA